MRGKVFGNSLLGKEQERYSRTAERKPEGGELENTESVTKEKRTEKVRLVGP